MLEVKKLLLAATALLLSACVTTNNPPLPPSTVKVMRENSHGSGVHIGRSFVLTVAHVVRAEKTVRLKTQGDAEVDAFVLWTNETYDVALLFAPSLNTAASPIACRVPAIGEQLRAFGNPHDEEFMQTWGRVSGITNAGDKFSGQVGVNITFIPGMSGGPVFDRHGNVVGLVRAALGQTAFGIVVPMAQVCHLLGRVS